jgi:hypothetical protein
MYLTRRLLHTNKTTTLGETKDKRMYSSFIVVPSMLNNRTKRWSVHDATIFRSNNHLKTFDTSPLIPQKRPHRGLHMEKLHCP